MFEKPTNVHNYEKGKKKQKIKEQNERINHFNGFSNLDEANILWCRWNLYRKRLT